MTYLQAKFSAKSNSISSRFLVTPHAIKISKRSETATFQDASKLEGNIEIDLIPHKNGLKLQQKVHLQEGNTKIHDGEYFLEIQVKDIMQKITAKCVFNTGGSWQCNKLLDVDEEERRATAAATSLRKLRILAAEKENEYINSSDIIAKKLDSIFREISRVITT